MSLLLQYERRYKIACVSLLCFFFVACSPLSFTRSRITYPSTKNQQTSLVSFKKNSFSKQEGSDEQQSLSQIDVAFSPYGYTLDLVLRGIRQAKSSIYVAAYAFTSKPIAMALLEAHNRNIDVRVIADEKANKGKYSAVTFLANHGIPIRVNNKYQIFHHKFMVIDGLHVQTGSFNYTASAISKNAENVLILWNTPSIALQYANEWQNLWKESEKVTPTYVAP